MMELAISGRPLSVFPLEKVMKIFAGVGVRAIEIWPENLAEDTATNPLFYDDVLPQLAAETLANAGAKVACVAFGAAFDREAATDEQKYSRELVRAVKTAKILGAKRVNHYCRMIAEDGVCDIDRFKRYFSAAIDAAEADGIVLCFENEAFDVNGLPETMAEIVEAMGSRYFKTNFDPANYYQRGVEPYPYAYNILRGKIAYVHLKDACVYDEQNLPELCHKGKTMLTAQGNRQMCYPVIGEGAVGIASLVKRLTDDGYDGYCTIEINAPAEKCPEFYKRDTEFLFSNKLFSAK